ncbi:hypothetical protein OROGR_007422 [Orobanche gracilis]
MGRKKLPMRRIENAAARQVTYAKRRDGIVKKAKELSVLCDTDVALIMFSPTGRLTTFASNGSLQVEDIFLRFVDRPGELRGGPINNEEFVWKAQNVEVRRGNAGKDCNMYNYCLADFAATKFSIEDLEEKLDKLNRRLRESQEKMRYYEPNIEKINSALEAGVYQQFLTSALQRVQMSKVIWSGMNEGTSRASI